MNAGDFTALTRFHLRFHPNKALFIKKVRGKSEFGEIVSPSFSGGETASSSISCDYGKEVAQMISPNSPNDRNGMIFIVMFR